MAAVSDLKKRIAIQLAKMGLIPIQTVLEVFESSGTRLNEDEKEIDMKAGLQEMFGNSSQAFAGDPAKLQNQAQNALSNFGLENTSGDVYYNGVDGIYQNGLPITGNTVILPNVLTTTGWWPSGITRSYGGPVSPFVFPGGAAPKEPEKIPMKAERDPNAPARRIMLEE